MKAKREKSTSTKGHYVTNGQLLPAVLEAKALGVVTDKLIKMIWQIAERYSHKHNFVGYSYREDMVCAAVMNLCNNALKFNPEKSSNPFSFYTTAIHNSFLQYMADEKKHRNIRDALLVDAGANPSFGYAEQDKEAHEFALRNPDGTIADELVEIVPEGNDAYSSVVALLDALRSNPAEYNKPAMSARAVSRMPSDIKVYKPEDISIDPETGSIVIREGAVPSIIEAKPPQPRVTKKPGRGRPPKPVDPSASIPPPKEKKTKKVVEVVEKPVKKAATKKTPKKEASKKKAK